MIAPERAITFECEGQRLVGVVSGPEEQKKLGLLVIVGGPQYRVGAHRQFVLLARKLAASGIPAMRFDSRGMGDSAGGRRTFLETGSDIAAAISAFQAACPALERVVLWGLCDAASASLLYWHATADKRVAGMVLVNPWVSSEEQFAQAQITRSFRRVLRPDFWVKLVRGGIDIPGAARSLFQAVAAMLGRHERDGPTTSLQDRMAAAMEAFDGPVLLALSGRDLVCAEFLALCDANARWRAILGRSNVEQHRLEDADHTFSETALRENFEAANIDWLERSFRRASTVRQLVLATSGMCSLILAQQDG